MNNFLLFACECDEPLNTMEDFESGWNSSNFVLELKIKGTSQKKDEPAFGSKILEAEVLKIYKGKISSRTIKIYSINDGGGSCSFPFESGKTYLFYGSLNDKKVFESSICDRTGELKDKSFDLKLLEDK